MCGIIGYVKRKNNSPINDLGIFGMSRAMKVQKHRGPDDDGVCGFCFSGEVKESDNPLDLLGKKFDGLFGFNRLSIKDLSIAGHQPMLSSDKKVILVFNGEIYNDAELREDLLKRGYTFNSTTDTEVILNLFLEYGFEKMVKMLNGMFGISIMDLRNNVMYLARDRFGIKPLYYSINDEDIFFASEMKCLIQFDSFQKELDIDAFNARIIFSRPSNKVLLKNVYLVNPGESIKISIDNDFIKREKYFDVNDYSRDMKMYNSIEEALSELDAVLEKAIRSQLVSDVKVGCQVSGGIDSSIVSYYANMSNVSNIKDGVSIIDGTGYAGEEYYIDQVGNTLNVDLHKFQLHTSDFVDNYEKLVWHNDAPVYKPYFTSFYILMKGAKDYVTVLMSGEGADELAGGYGRFGAGVLQPFITRFGRGLSSIYYYSSYAEYAVKSDSTICDGLIMQGYKETDKLIQEQIDMFDSFTGSNFMKQLKFETYARLPESFLRQDKMSMACSIENRVPLVDNRVADFLMSLPEDMLLRFGDISPVNLSDNPFEWVQGKYILKELCSRQFSRDFAYRKKQIMAFDEKKMLSSAAFRELFYELIYPKMKNRSLIDASIIKSWFDNVENLNAKEFNNMWRIIGLETWCQLFLDKNWCK